MGRIAAASNDTQPPAAARHAQIRGPERAGGHGEPIAGLAALLNASARVAQLMRTRALLNGRGGVVQRQLSDKDAETLRDLAGDDIDEEIVESLIASSTSLEQAIERLEVLRDYFGEDESDAIEQDLVESDQDIVDLQDTDELEQIDDVFEFLANSPIPEDDNLDLIDDSEYMPGSPWKKYFDVDTTEPSTAKGFEKVRRKNKQLDETQHFNFQTFTFGLGARSDEINLYRSTEMNQVKRLKKLRGDKNFLDVQQYTPQFSRGFVTGGIDTKKPVFLPEGVEDNETFVGRKNKGTAVLGREVLTFLQSGYKPQLVEREFPKPRTRKQTIPKQVFSLLPPETPTLDKDQVTSIWDMSVPNPSIEIDGKKIFATTPKRRRKRKRKHKRKHEMSLSEYFLDQMPRKKRKTEDT